MGFARSFPKWYIQKIC